MNEQKWTGLNKTVRVLAEDYIKSIKTDDYLGLDLTQAKELIFNKAQNLLEVEEELLKDVIRIRLAITVAKKQENLI